MKWEEQISQSVLFALGIVEVFIGLRVILRLLGANPIAPLVSWVYGVTDTLLYPFAGMFPVWRLGRLGALELSSIFAMIFYAILTYFVLELLGLVLGWQTSIWQTLRRRTARP